MKLAIACVGLAVAACDPQVDGSFAGDPRVRVTGTLTGFRTDDVVDGGEIRWNTQVGVDLRTGPTSAMAVQDLPPVGVEVDVFDVPDAGVEFAMADGATVSEGHLFLLAGGSRIGDAVNYALVYVDRDADAGSLAAAYLGGAVSRGFHLCIVVPTVNVPAPQEPFVTACGGTPDCASQRRYKLALADRDVGETVQFFRSGAP